MNTALVLHFLVSVQHAVHGRHFPGWTVTECFQWVKVVHGDQLGRRLVCGTIHVWEHGAIIKWR